MKKILLALVFLIGASLPAVAQGCGPQNPNCIVPTAPAGTCDNRAASTQYACTAGSALVAPGRAKDLPMYNNAGTGLIDSAVPLAPAGALNLYASPTGNDTNNTCMASGTPCTLKGACSIHSAIATFLATGNIKINLAAGTYSSVDANNTLCSILGNQGGSSSQLATIVGDCVTPANVILAIPANDIGLFVKDGGEASLQCVKITGGNGSQGVSVAQFSIGDLTNITWGTWGTGGRHITVALGGVSNVNGETITANIGFHAVVSGNSNLNNVGTITIPNAVVWGNAFLSATGANVDFGSATFTGAGVAGTTGPRAILVGPGYLYTGGVAVDTFFPGSVASSITQGFSDDANDPQTAAFNLQAASVTNAKLANPATTVLGTTCTLGSSCTPSTKQVLVGGNGASSVATNTTAYSGLSGASVSTQLAAAEPYPVGGTFKNLYFSTTAAPGGGQTYTMTLYVGSTPSGLSATALTCQASGASTTTCNDTLHTAAITAGQYAALQIVTSNGAATLTGTKWGVELDNP